MRKAISLTLVLILATIVTAKPLSGTITPNQDQQAELTNKDVLEMVKAGLSAAIIITKIKTSPAKFDTGSATLAELKAANVPDSVILAMVEARSTTKTPMSSVEQVETSVPDGTEMEIQLKNNLSGQEAKVGDIVDFTVVRAVQINGVTVFEKDASARARVTTAKKAGRWGKAGKIEWAMQDVQATDGNRIPARFTKRELGDSKGGTVAVAAVATTVLLGPVGLLWGLKKGKPAVIPAGNRYSVFVHGDTKVKGKMLLAP
jgi:hypothetical protein